MASRIFVNLPVSDLKRSIAFFESLGFRFNPQFTDDKAGCMVVSDDIHVMLLMRDYFKTFTPKAVGDAKRSTEVLLALSQDDRQAVDALVRKAVAAGGATYAEPRDHGFMYQHGFEDPDGHIWEIFWMDPAAVQQA